MQDPVSAAQLQAARTTLWHQAGEPLLTLEAAREWLLPLGLVFFAPRAQQLGAPAPSFVEATLGAANEAPSLAETETARSLAARLVGEGNAVPLNLLGGPGDAPDFLATAQVFSFLYTLRGDKLWKQPPATSGTNKVTPLALSVYEMLAERGGMSAAELASELGRELTESAIARALSELWQHMRVIPLLQQGEAATLWETTSRRFTKAIKAGTNAGQPTALSALVSLYLAQALLAGEDEIAAFLSPVAARSRIKEVLHALLAARELNELVIDGKTLLHIPGALPAFPEIEAPAAAEGEETSTEETAAPAEGDDTGRIKRFAPRTAAGDRDAYRGKRTPREGSGFGSRPGGGGFRKSFGAAGPQDRGPRPPRREGSTGQGERERRPFRRDEGSPDRPQRGGFRPDRTSDRPARTGDRPPRSQYAKPWADDRRPRRDAGAESEGRPPRREERGSEGGQARPFRPRPAGDRPAGDRPARKPFGERPPRRFEGGEDRPRRSYGSGDGDRPRRNFAGGDRPAREGGFRPVRREGAGEDRPPYRGREEGGASRPPYRRREEGEGGRPPRAGGGRPSFGDRARSGPPAGERRPYRPRPEGEGGERPRRSFGDRDSRAPRGDRPFRSNTSERSDRGEREEGARPRRSGDTVPFGERKGPARGGKPFGERKPFGDRKPFGERKPFGDRKPAGERKPFGDRKPAGKFAGKRPFSKGPAKGAGRGPARGPRPDRPARPPRREE